MRKLTSLAAVSVVALLLAGCSAGQGDGRACSEVSDELLSRIADGANGIAITPVAGAAVKSESMAEAYIVAMEFEVADNPNQVGTWAVGALDGASPVLGIDGTAHAFTDWPDEFEGQQFDATEDGVTEAIACLDRD